MKNADNILEELNILDEHTQIEAKSISMDDQLGESILDTISAFSNEPNLGGGYLILGVTRKNDKYVATGINNPDKIQNDLTTLCATKFSTPIRPLITVNKLPNNKIVIAVFIEEQPAQLKPVTFEKRKRNKTTVQIQKVAYRRIGSADCLCTAEDYELFTILKQNKSYDETILSNTTLADIDTKAISEYRSLRKNANPKSEELKYNDEELLLSLHCAEKINDTTVPTIAGLLLFGTEDVLKRRFPSMRFDYLWTAEKDWDSLTLTSNYISLEYRESIMTLLPKVETAIMANIGKKISTNTGRLTRDEQPLLPRDVLREALVNAVMHRDYRETTSILVVQYPDRIEITNPGYSLKPINSLIQIGGSKARNQIIANVLHDTEYAENKGTGIKKIIGLMQKANLNKPIFLSYRNDNSFKAIFYLHQLITENTISWLTRYKNYNLTSDEANLLVYTYEHNNSITNEEGRKITGLDTLKVSRLLTNLRKKGVLVQHSAGSNTYYTLNQNYLSSNINSDNNNFNKNTSNNSKPEIDKRKSLLAALPEDIRKDLLSQSKRLTHEKTNELILKICSINAYSIEEISIIFGKAKRWAKNPINELLQTGKLEQTIPEKPKSKQQKYITNNLK